MEGTLLFDRSSRARYGITGPQATASLNGLVTNNVATLAPGQGHYAAILTAKGKIIADVRVFRLDDALWVDTVAAAAEGVRGTLTKYMNPRFAKVTDLGAEFGALGVFGANASASVAAACGVAREALVALPAHGHLSGDVAGNAVRIIRVPGFGTDGFEIFVPTAISETLREALIQHGATPADPATWHALRVAAGWPEWGSDMNEDTLPQEANFDELQGVSYDKGCYVGQETVARIHFRGHVNKSLRRLALGGLVDVPTGATLAAEDGKVVGDIRSVARLADGRQVAIGMVRREIPTGAMLTAQWEGTVSGISAEVLGQAAGIEG